MKQPLKKLSNSPIVRVKQPTIHAEIDAKEDARIKRCLKKTQYGSRANLLRVLISEALSARGF